MRDDSPSRTAAFVAAARQLGTLLPPEAQLVEDPYGAAFASPMFSRLLERRQDTLRPFALIPGLSTWILYMQVRTRVIDDALRAWIEGGGGQLVLLGAGYDCRALRMPELASTEVFEVDHPATQARKKAILTRMGARSPSHYVTWDFEQRPMEDLPDVLVEAGLDLARPTFTIWEGVTMYLTDAAIDASLRAIRAWSAPGSQLAMTYFAKSRITRPSFVTRAMKAVVGAVGEPWKFGWTPDELPAYLEEREFRLVRDIAMADAAYDLLPTEMARHVASPDRRFALAAAPESIAVVS